MKTTVKKAKEKARPKTDSKATAGEKGKRKPAKRPPVIDILSLLAVRAFGQGFLAGADPRRALRRHCVEPATHEHWRRGFDAGRAAISMAELTYGLDLKTAPVRAARSR